MRNLQLPGRSPARSERGMAATSHPLATQAALDVLKAGGNAVDAAVCACAVLAVVEPQSTGIGGDCFALIAKPNSDDVIAYNGSGTAPAAASVEKLAELGITGSLPRTSPHSVTIPGAIDAWSRLVEDHGRLPFSELLAPAIGYARNGYLVGDRIAFDWKFEVEVLRGNETARRIFLPNDDAPCPGQRHHQRELADTLELIAKEGRDAFYSGALATRTLETLNGLGGLHTAKDFAEYSGAYVTPIKTRFMDHDVYECPPNGQGIIALMIMNCFTALERRGASIGSNPRSADRLHIEIEVARQCYALRDAHLADPSQADIDVDWLLSDKLADSIAARVSLGVTTPVPAHTPATAVPHQDTVYLCVVDEDRTAVSLINSTFFSFGSGITTPDGIVLHNRGMSFRLEPDHPNCIAGGKRPMHTIIPGMLKKDGQTIAPFGVMGGHYQALGQAHLLSGVLKYGMDPQSALDAPRVMFEGDDVEIEDATGQSVRDGLAQRGHRLVRALKPIGGGQIIMIDHDYGTLIGGSDPRKDGLALGY